MLNRFRGRRPLGHRPVSGAAEQGLAVARALAGLLRVRLAAAGLGQAARYEVARAENRHVQPGLPGDELVGPVVAAVDDRGTDQDRDDQPTIAQNSVVLNARLV